MFQLQSANTLLYYQWKDAALVANVVDVPEELLGPKIKYAPQKERDVDKSCVEVSYCMQERNMIFGFQMVSFQSLQYNVYWNIYYYKGFPFQIYFMILYLDWFEIV